jgi:hypothetical protein
MPMTLFFRMVRAGLAGALLAAVSASAVRGADDDILFTAKLTPDEQSAPTYSPASGMAEVRLERETLKITWKITYKDLTGPATVAGLYGPENVGANAGMVVDLAANGLKSPIEGSAVLSDGVFQYLITGRVYVNIHTAKYPDGELRGQLRRTPKPAG